MPSSPPPPKLPSKLLRGSSQRADLPAFRLNLHMLFGVWFLTPGLVARAPSVHGSFVPTTLSAHRAIVLPAASAAVPRLHSAVLSRTPPAVRCNSPAVSRSAPLVMREADDGPVSQCLAGLTVAFSLLSKAIACAAIVGVNPLVQPVESALFEWTPSALGCSTRLRRRVDPFLAQPPRRGQRIVRAPSYRCAYL